MNSPLTGGEDADLGTRIRRISEAKDAEPDMDVISKANLCAAESDSLRRTSMSEEFVEDGKVIRSLQTLHGKLATAEVNLKARKLEENMTEEERKEVTVFFLFAGWYQTISALRVFTSWLFPFRIL